ncbi:Squalene monooxygenase [Psilocybe cubensis]|uniref:Squalene monooxygenase n=2 Tax=Psilocybe cubensis TaxID=181762 RepID=A0A8H8CH62_PSICU|nr:Squalene monooxygenase [Psilocybe cubensis]KAH9479128.1 Squalene monooxygenase [Psilocybe cubensis]
MASSKNYDVIIVGAGIAGCALAHGLSTAPRDKPLRIALVERSLAEPDRIVGELLQPGGVIALKRLGLESCLEGIDAIPVNGYCVVKDGQTVHIPYPGKYEGRSFHHGRFIMKLREAAMKAKGVDVIEGSVTELIQTKNSRRILGASVTKKGENGAEDTKYSLYADLVIVADGCFSNFRNQVMGKTSCKPVTKSHFVGAVLEDAKLPIPHHGTVALVKGFGPVLLYQISEHDTRILIDVKQPLPDDLKGHIINNIIPQLPSNLHQPIYTALEKDRLRRMPNSFLPPIKQGARHSKEGAILIGDSWNMRHPLTGGGMTVALNDVVVLRDLLVSLPDFKNWKAMKSTLHDWHWSRKPLASTVNILSVALYDLFGADSDELQVLRTGCFKYFELGGECINGPVSLLSATTPSPALLAYHFFSVAFYAIWVMFTHPVEVPTQSPPKSISNGNGHASGNGHANGVKPVLKRPSIIQYPALCIKSILVFWTACVVFGPLVWSEVRWWSPLDTSKRNHVLINALLPFVVLAVAVSGVVPGTEFLSIR